MSEQKMTAPQPTAADRKLAEEIHQFHVGQSYKLPPYRSFTVEHLSGVIGRHVSAVTAEKDAEIGRLKRFVDAVVLFVESEDMSNQDRDRNIRALASAWKKLAAEAAT